MAVEPPVAVEPPELFEPPVFVEPPELFEPPVFVEPPEPVAPPVLAEPPVPPFCGVQRPQLMSQKVENQGLEHSLVSVAQFLHVAPGQFGSGGGGASTHALLPPVPVAPALLPPALVPPAAAPATPPVIRPPPPEPPLLTPDPPAASAPPLVLEPPPVLATPPVTVGPLPPVLLAPPNPLKPLAPASVMVEGPASSPRQPPVATSARDESRADAPITERRTGRVVAEPGCFRMIFMWFTGARRRNGGFRTKRRFRRPRRFRAASAFARLCKVTKNPLDAAINHRADPIQRRDIWLHCIISPTRFSRTMIGAACTGPTARYVANEYRLQRPGTGTRRGEEARDARAKDVDGHWPFLRLAVVRDLRAAAHWCTRGHTEAAPKKWVSPESCAVRRSNRARHGALGTWGRLRRRAL